MSSYRKMIIELFSYFHRLYKPKDGFEIWLEMIRYKLTMLKLEFDLCFVIYEH